MLQSFLSDNKNIDTSFRHYAEDILDFE